MLASELAQELGIDPSLMSKRLGVYYWEAGKDRPRLVDAQTAGHVRHAHALFESGQARSFRDAVQMALGTFVEAIPPESVRELESRLTQIESVQREILDTVTRILRHIESAIVPQSAGDTPHGH